MIDYRYFPNWSCGKESIIKVFIANTLFIDPFPWGLNDRSINTRQSLPLHWMLITFKEFAAIHFPLNTQYTWLKSYKHSYNLKFTRLRVSNYIPVFDCIRYELKNEKIEFSCLVWTSNWQTILLTLQKTKYQTKLCCTYGLLLFLNCMRLGNSDSCSSIHTSFNLT